jgi:Arc/MetJ family transcription regulator
VEYALRQLAIAPKTREEVLAMRGSGFELTNEEIEGDWSLDG